MSYKMQESITLPRHMCSHPVFWWYMYCSSFWLSLLYICYCPVCPILPVSLDTSFMVYRFSNDHVILTVILWRNSWKDSSGTRNIHYNTQNSSYNTHHNTSYIYYISLQVHILQNKKNTFMSYIYTNGSRHTYILTKFFSLECIKLSNFYFHITSFTD
jgi:hypothetical protein